MKISDLIKELEKVEQHLGNIELYTESNLNAYEIFIYDQDADRAKIKLITEAEMNDILDETKRSFAEQITCDTAKRY